MPLRLEARGIRDLKSKLRALGVNLSDMEGLWEKYGVIMADTEAAWFDSAGDGSWPPLANYTLRHKRRLMDRGAAISTDPLIRTGQLFESLTDPAQAMDVSQGHSTIGTFTRNAMTWGTDVKDARGKEYAHYHQNVDPVTGEPASYPPDPPMRQPIPWPLPIETETKFDAADEEWVREMIEKSGLGGD